VDGARIVGGPRHLDPPLHFIVSIAADIPDQETAAQRLLRNRTEIGDALKPFDGEDAGDSLTALLRDHILVWVDILSAGVVRQFSERFA
jgi:hypothetical protein